MSFSDRKILYEQIESAREIPLLVYVTSQRPGIGGQISADVIDQFIDQIRQIPDEKEEVDLLIESLGGDGVTSWRIVSLLRTKFKKVNVLIPHSAFSAATLLALGADQIIMGKFGSLGPIDPQITVRKKDGTVQQFGYEDLTAFLDFAKNEGGLTEQTHLEKAFTKLSDTVEPAVLGFASRSSYLSTAIGEKLLQKHMEDKVQATAIARKLNKNFFNHGHALSRDEAKEIGLNIVIPSDDLEEKMWSIHKSFEEEVQARKPFNVISEFLSTPGAESYLKSPAPVILPTNINPQQIMQVIYQLIQDQLTATTPEVEKEIKHAFVESKDMATEFFAKYRILLQRLSDLNFNATLVELEKGWRETVAGVAPVEENSEAL